MSTSRPGVLRIGARVRFEGVAQTVAGLSGTLVHLAGQDGQASVVQLAHLLASEGFEIIGGAARTRLPLSAAALGGVPEGAAGDARPGMPGGGSGTSSRFLPGFPRIRRPGQLPGRGLTLRSARWRSVSRPRRRNWRRRVRRSLRGR